MHPDVRVDDVHEDLVRVERVGGARVERRVAVRAAHLVPAERVHLVVDGGDAVSAPRPSGPRSSSDTSAALFAALLGAERLEIWTDVHGLFTADPRYVDNARLICRLSFREAQELAATLSEGALAQEQRIHRQMLWFGLRTSSHLHPTSSHLLPLLTPRFSA